MAEDISIQNGTQFPPYKIVCQTGSGEYTEKKSRFIASITSVNSEEEAQIFFDTVRKKHYDARHNCTAFIIGRNKEMMRCSDDGEPSGTAGKPILEVLLGADVTNVAAVVTRYFGGTLLGTGGLVRAYTQATKEGLANAGIALMCYGTRITLMADYPDMGKIQYFLEKEQIDIKETRYTDKVETDILVPSEKFQYVKNAVIQATSARAGIEVTGAGYYIDKKMDVG